LALRGRFETYKSLEFASEIIRQVQCVREARDHRGRPRIVPRDIVAMVDAAREFANKFSSSRNESSNVNDRFASSTCLLSLVKAASRRILGHEVQEYDATQPERFLALPGFNERIQAECLSVLQQGLAEPEASTAIASLIDAGTTASATLNSATSNLLGCGSDRRTLIFVPRIQMRNPTTEELRQARPLAAVIPADVDDVMVIAEESAISPRSVAQGLGRMYPGVADAANRLHTRTDVPWTNLL
jgi:hypothetical protein